jgi:phosphoribosyl-dephospho-CoA transferase
MSKYQCWGCGEDIDNRRWDRGYRTCLVCGEAEARKVKHTVAPLHKSNYIMVTNHEDLKGLNNKGGIVK